jgi:hypothetical protein
VYCGNLRNRYVSCTSKELDGFLLFFVVCFFSCSDTVEEAAVVFMWNEGSSSRG